MRKKLLAVLLAMCMAVSLLPAAALAADHWAAGSIKRWTEEGVLDGSSLDPEARMTRAEFAQMLCSLMGYTQTSDTVFSDLPADDPAAEAISKLVKAGVMNGVGGGKVDPNGTLTREQAAVMLCRALDIRPSSSAMSSFKDSASVSSWAAGAMAALTERGMLHGVGGGLLAPGGLVSNGTAAALVDKMVGEYVTEDRTITGEVKGVVLVVKGAKAEIKDATLSDPVVVKDAAATLTNTKADDVVANGGTVTTDAKTTVVNVTLTGEAPKATISGSVAGDVTAAGSKAVLDVKGDVAGSVELKGETPKATIEGKVEGNVTAAGTKPQVEVKGDVAGTVSVGGSDAKVDLKGEVAGGVTVAADATGKPAVTAPKGTEVKNDSSTSANVNGGTVASGDNTTTTTNPSTPGGSTGGSSSGGDSTGGGSTGGGNTGGGDTPPATHTHAWGDGVVTTPATCTTKGVKTFTCTAEGCTDGPATKTEEIPMVDHTYGDWAETTAATCANPGVKTKTCSVCGATETDEIAKTTDHTYGTTPVMVSATQHKYTCSVCGNEKTEDHDTKGAGGACTCGYKVTTEDGDDAQSHVHVYNDTPDEAKSEAATCNKEGKNVYTCKGVDDGEGNITTCTATKTVPIPKLDHTWPTANATEGVLEGGWKVKSGSEGDCKTAPTLERECTVCHTKETKTGTLDTNAHKSATLAKKDATCTEAGYEAGTKCSVCNKVLTGGEPIAPLGHDWGEWSAETGKRSCSRAGCDATETCSHANAAEDTSTAKAATCTEKGKEADTVCPVCKYVTKKGAEIPATGHSYQGEGDTYKGTPVKKDDTNHTYTCTNASCTETTEGHTKDVAHSYTEGTCVCGAKKVYTITIGTITNGTVTADKGTGANKGDTVVLTVTPATGYQIKSVSYTSAGTTGAVSVTADTEGAYKFTMPDADVTVTAVFEKIEYTLSVAEGIEGVTFTVGENQNAGKATKGDTVTVKFEPQTGKTAKVSAVDAKNQPVEVTEKDGAYTFDMPAANVTVTVEFETETPGGTGDGEGDGNTGSETPQS